MTSDQSHCPFCGAELEVLYNPFVSGSPIPVAYYPCDCARAQEERRHKAEQEREKTIISSKEKRFLQRLKNSKIPRHYQQAELDDDKYIELIRSGRSLVFSGAIGTGKTYLACAIGLAMLNETTVIFSSIAEINAAIFAHNKTEEELMSELSDCGLLILDDLGKEKPSVWVATIVFRIINARYEQEKPLIITTNYSYGGLEDKFNSRDDLIIGTSIVSRLREMCGRPILFNGKDLRLLQ